MSLFNHTFMYVLSGIAANAEAFGQREYFPPPTHTFLSS